MFGQPIMSVELDKTMGDALLIFNPLAVTAPFDVSRVDIEICCAGSECNQEGLWSVGPFEKVNVAGRKSVRLPIRLEGRVSRDDVEVAIVYVEYRMDLTASHKPVFKASGTSCRSKF